MGAPGRARHGRPRLRGVDAGGRGADVVAAGRERVEPGGRGRTRPVWRRRGRPGPPGGAAGGRGADVVAAGRGWVETGGGGRMRPVWRRRVVDGEDQGKQTGRPGQGRQRMKQWFSPKAMALPRVAVV